MFSFLSLINNSVTIGLRILLLSISAIISSKSEQSGLLDDTYKSFNVFILSSIIRVFNKSFRIINML